MVSAITIEQLSSSKDVLLTGAQRDSIKTPWRQGSFGEGWFSASFFKTDDIVNKFTIFNHNGILIDVF